jgi:mannose-6-phosphate isomerase class I
MIERLVVCHYYTVDKYTVRGELKRDQTEPFLICSVVEGSGTIDGIAIKKGDHFIIPFAYGEYKIVGDLDMICSCTPLIAARRR